VLGPKPAFLSYHMMRMYNARFKAIAEARRAAGTAGARNNGHRIKAYFNLGLGPLQMVLRGLRIWMRAEAEVARLRFRRTKRRSAATAPLTPPA
jgi:hypothetical protein